MKSQGMTDAEQARAIFEAKGRGVQASPQHAGPARGMSTPLPLPPGWQGAGPTSFGQAEGHAPLHGTAEGQGDEGEAQEEASPAEHSALEVEGVEEVSEAQQDDPVNAAHYLQLPEPVEDNRPPAWFPVQMVPRMRFPRGVDVVFVRIRGSLTAAKHKGDRYLIAWELSDGDEKLAYGRSMNDVNRATGELSKQMIRVVDGTPVSWSGLPGVGNLDQFWAEIGAKGRSQMQKLYVQLHVFDKTEQADFFESCVARVRTG